MFNNLEMPHGGASIHDEPQFLTLRHDATQILAHMTMQRPVKEIALATEASFHFSSVDDRAIELDQLCHVQLGHEPPCRGYERRCT